MPRWMYDAHVNKLVCFSFVNLSFVSLIYGAPANNLIRVKIYFKYIKKHFSSSTGDIEVKNHRSGLSYPALYLGCICSWNESQGGEKRYKKVEERICHFCICYSAKSPAHLFYYN